MLAGPARLLSGLLSRHPARAAGSVRALRRAVALTIVLALAVLPGAAPTLARAQRTALAGEQRLLFGTPAREWVAGGRTHIRGILLTGTFAFSGAGVALAGVATRLDDGTFDADGNGRVWGVATYTDAATGMTCTGPSVGTLTGFLEAVATVAHCSNGALLRGTERGTGFIVDGDGHVTGVVSEFRGVLLQPDR
jgi:hypothetical protein